MYWHQVCFSLLFFILLHNRWMWVDVCVCMQVYFFVSKIYIHKTTINGTLLRTHNITFFSVAPVFLNVICGNPFAVPFNPTVHLISYTCYLYYCIVWFSPSDNRIPVFQLLCTQLAGTHCGSRSSEFISANSWWYARSVSLFIIIISNKWPHRASISRAVAIISFKSSSCNYKKKRV